MKSFWMFPLVWIVSISAFVLCCTHFLYFCLKADTPLTKAAQKKAAAALAAQAAARDKQEAQREAADEAAELKAQANPGSPAEWEAKYKVIQNSST